MKKSKLFLLSLVLIVGVNLSGCIKYIYVPVPSCTKPKEIDKPKMKTNLLTGRSTEDEVLSALLFDFTELDSLYRQCTIVLDEYRK